MNLIEEIGHRYGRLVVIQRAGSKSCGAAWLCECDCGTKVTVRGRSLRTGITRSCGCLRNETASRIHSLPEGEASFNALYKKLTTSAKKRRIEWQLTRKQVRILTKKICHYCGVEPRQILYRRSPNGVYVYNGIDRIDNSRGYIIDNVVPCCGNCNRAKFAMPIEEFKEWISKIYMHFVEKPHDSDF